MTERPWFKVGVGVPLEGRLSTGLALALTKLNYEVSKVSMVTRPKIQYLRDDNGNIIPGPDKCGIIDRDCGELPELAEVDNPQMCMTVRADRDSNGNLVNKSYLGTVGKTYGVLQNADAVAFADEALGDKSACVSAVGTMGRYGARFFMMLTLPDMLEILPGEPVERNILLTNTHDGSSPFEALFVGWSDERGSMVVSPGNRVRLRHTKNVRNRAARAHKLLEENQEYWDRARRAFAYMSKRDVDAKRLREFLEALFPDIPEKDPDTKKAVRDAHGNPVLKTSPRAAAAREAIQNVFEATALNLPRTDLGLYNAVAYFVGNKRRVGKKAAGHKISRWELSLFGGGAKLRDRAWRWLHAE